MVNIGNGHPVRLLSDSSRRSKRASAKTAIRNYLPIQPGDVPRDLRRHKFCSRLTGFQPATPVATGVDRFYRMVPRGNAGCDSGRHRAFRSVTTLLTGGAGLPSEPHGCTRWPMPASAWWCSTISRPASIGRWRRDAPLVIGDTGDQARVRGAARGAPGRRHHPLRRLDRGAGLGPRSARLLPQQHRELARPDRDRGQERRAPFHLLLDRRGLRQSRAHAGGRGAISQLPTSPYGSSKLMTEIMLRDAGAAHGLRHADPALLQRRRRRPARGRTGQIHQGGDPSHQGRGRGRARTAPKIDVLRHRLSDAGRYLRPGLYSCPISSPRIAPRSPTCAAAALSTTLHRWLRPRLLRARRDRDDEADLRRGFSRSSSRDAGRAIPRRSSPHASAPFHARMAAAIRRSRDHHRARALAWERRLQEQAGADVVSRPRLRIADLRGEIHAAWQPARIEAGNVPDAAPPDRGHGSPGPKTRQTCLSG